MTRRLLLLSLAVLALAAPARADDAPEATEADQAAAKAVVESYLATCVKSATAKKPSWDAAKKAVHPKRLEDIADIKKRTGVEKHALAAWAAVGEHYLEKFEIAGTSPSGKGAVVVATTEDHYLVEDKGHDEGVQAEYLVLPVDGQWFIVDRRLGTGQFPSAKVGASYRGYFAGEFEMPKAPEPPAKGGKKGKK